MRLSLLLTPLVIAASVTWVGAQTPPAQNPDLPVVIKPKPAPAAKQKPEDQPDPNVAADPDKPDPEEPVDVRTLKKKKDAAAADAADAANSASPVDTNGGPDYTGPAILSRGMTFTRPSLPANERFRPFVGANFYRDSGVTGPYQGPLSPVTQQSFTGADFLFGISGTHVRRFDVFELDYRGHAYVNGYSGQDHALTVGYSRVLTKRMTATVSESAGLYANNYAVLNSVAVTDTSVANTALVVTPNTESFDDRTYYSTTQGDLTYQKNARLSFNFGASGFFVKREAKNLISANGYQARSDIAYRVTKKSTLGPYYAYSRYYYSGTFGDSDIHTVGLNYSYALNKRLQLQFRAGASRLETRGLQVVVLDPVVSEILGTSIGIQRYYAVTYSPDFAINITRSVRHGSFTASYLKGISPGNGVILTSNREGYSGNYNYTGIRRYALTVGAGRDSLSSVAQEIGNYSSYYGRVSLSRALPHNVQALFNFDYRKLGFTANSYNRNQYRISIGFAFAPSPGPLKFW